MDDVACEFACAVRMRRNVSANVLKNHCYQDKRSIIYRFQISANSRLMHSFSSNTIFHACDENLKI